jgi:hypothetical protein
MLLTLIALSKVDDKDADLAPRLVNTGHVVGGSIRLAILDTLAWTVVANPARSSVNAPGRATRCTRRRRRSRRRRPCWTALCTFRPSWHTACRSTTCSLKSCSQRTTIRPDPAPLARIPGYLPGYLAGKGHGQPIVSAIHKILAGERGPQMTSGLDKASAVIITTLLGHLAAP